MRNIKKYALVLIVALFGLWVTGCNVSINTSENIPKAEESADVVEETAEIETVEEAVETREAEEKANTQSDKEDIEEVLVRVASLKGPTSMGLVKLIDDYKEGNVAGNYSFEMKTGADEILPLLASGELDIALIPANAASNLYAKTEGKIKVIDINTLGVLYVLSADDSITSVAELEGKTIILTGKGTTPDYVLQSLIAKNDVKDVTLEYKSEATEVAATLTKTDNAIGLLPQPFVTVAQMQNENLKVVLDLNKEWENANDGNSIVTGVTVVRSDFYEENKEAVDAFVAAHKESADYIVANPEEGSKLVVKQGIIEKEPVALKAIPNCNIVCITGDEMKEKLSNYLEVLYSYDEAFVGGKVPDENFYAVK